MVNLASSELGTGSPERFREFLRESSLPVFPSLGKRREEGVTLMCIFREGFGEGEVRTRC